MLNIIRLTHRKDTLLVIPENLKLVFLFGLNHVIFVMGIL